MTSASALMDTASLLLFQNLRQGMETGRITNMNMAQTEVEAAIAELNRRLLPEESSTHIHDLVGKLFLEIGSLQEKVAKCEVQLSEFQSQAQALRDDTTQIVTRTEACHLLVEQQQKENAKVLATVEGVKASVPTSPLPCVAPVPSPTDPTLHPSPSRVAVVSFPGGPRTITIHPPDSPSYESTIRDEKGDVIIDFRRPKPLRREGAFNGALEDIDCLELSRVYGRGPDPPGARAIPPTPHWPDRSQPSSRLSASRGSSNIIARQRQLSTSIHTDAFGRVLAPEYHFNAKSPSLPPGVSLSSHASSKDSQTSSSAKPEITSTPSSTPPSPSLGRGKKRARNSEEDDGSAKTSEHVSLPVDLRTIKEPMTPTPIKREESHPLEGPAKRKKLRSSASLEALSTGSLSRTRSSLDLTRAA